MVKTVFFKTKSRNKQEILCFGLKSDEDFW